jgi:hypothetical protein
MTGLSRFNLLTIYYLQRTNKAISPTYLSLILLKMTSDYSFLNNDEIYLPFKWEKGKYGWFCRELESSIRAMYSSGLLASYSIPKSKYFVYKLSEGVPDIQIPEEWREIVLQTVEFAENKKDANTLQTAMKFYKLHPKYNIETYRSPTHVIDDELPE